MNMKGLSTQNGSVVIYPDGSTGQVDANGFLNVPAAFVNNMITAGFLPVLPDTNAYTTDDGTTQTLTAVMLTGGPNVFHLSTGGATPTLTTPPATLLLAAVPNMAVGDSYILRILNNNSGIVTITGGTGVTITGAATTAAATWISFRVLRTAAATATMQYIGKGVV